MTDMEKMKAGMEYSFADPELIARKGLAIEMCAEYNAIKGTDYAAQYEYLKNTSPTLSFHGRKTNNKSNHHHHHHHQHYFY